MSKYDDGRITVKAPYGQHIKLTCKNHPHLFWFTKNIDQIGARTIFFEPSLCNYEAECDCSVRDLIVAE